MPFLGRYLDIQTDLLKQKHEMIIDGEIVSYNDKGEPSFQLMQHFPENPKAHRVYHVFDLIYLNGHSTRDLTLLERKELLKEALVETDHVKYCDHIKNDGVDFYQAILKSNIEGIMAKKKTSIYIDGKRSEDWLKIKNNQTDEAVIVGYTEPKGSRKYFGSLILGRYNKGELQYSGHVGTGFSDEAIRHIYKIMQPLVVNEMPFSRKPDTNMPPTWLEPKLVATIKYTQITKEGRFRHPVFIGIREDVSVEDLKSEDSEDNTTIKIDKPLDLNFTNVDKLR